MTKYETRKCSSAYLKNIKYKGALVPFKYCSLCLKVVRGVWAGQAKRYVKLGDGGHECVNALENMSKIYAEDRSRYRCIQLEMNLFYLIQVTICYHVT